MPRSVARARISPCSRVPSSDNDAGYTPDAYANNLEYLKIDPAVVDALIVSHGHYDHRGALTALLEAQRGEMRKDLRLDAGGEDAFCHRVHRAQDSSFSDYGPMIDRGRLKALGVEIVQ